jgi:hypothetical protein
MTSSSCRDGFEFSCDDCGTVWSPPKLGRGSAKRDFMESWELAKDEGWRAFKGARDEWQHRCPECA